MPYSIITKDGIRINNIPDDVPRDSQILKDRVLQARQQKQQSISTDQPQVTRRQILEQQARDSGALPGLAITPEQMSTIKEGGQIQPDQRTLDQREFRPVQGPTGEENPFLTSTRQGILNTGTGLLNLYGAVAKKFGSESANRLLKEAAISQNIELQKTDQITKDSPISRLVGEALGETLAIPVGGFGKALFSRLASAAGIGATTAGLSASGRGKSQEEILQEAAIGGVLGAGLEGAFTAGRSALDARRGRQVERATQGAQGNIDDIQENIQEGILAESMTGIRTLPAQKSQDPFLIEQQSFLGQNPQVSPLAFNVLRQQNREASNAVGDLLNLVAIPDNLGSTGTKARDAATNIISSAKDRRTMNSNPIFQDAFRVARRDGDLVDTSSLLRRMDGVNNEFESTAKIPKIINRFKEKIVNSNGDLQKLQGVKIEMDEAIERAHKSTGIGTHSKRLLSQFKNDLVNKMRDSSVLYNNAMDKFIEDSPAVEALEQGVFGKIAKLDDVQLKNTAGIIFDPAQPKEVSINAIKALKGVEGGHEIASELLRTEMQKRLASLKDDVFTTTETGGRSIENLPNKMLNGLFGNSQKKRVLFDSLSELNSQAFKNAKWLEKSLVQAGSGRPGGSQTGIRNVIEGKFRNFSNTIKNLFVNPVASLSNVAEEVAYDERVRAIGEMLYDATWQPDMARIRQLNPNSSEAGSKLTELFNTIVDANQKTRTAQAVSTSIARQEDK